MTCQLTFDQKPAYLHAVVTGPNTSETAARYLGEVMRQCATPNTVR